MTYSDGKKKVALIAVLIAISASYDFYRGYSHEKSIAEGGLSVVFGLILVTNLWWAFSRRN
jgi:hypothetical protein